MHKDGFFKDKSTALFKTFLVYIQILYWVKDTGFFSYEEIMTGIFSCLCE